MLALAEDGTRRRIFVRVGCSASAGRCFLGPSEYDSPDIGRPVGCTYSARLEQYLQKIDRCRESAPPEGRQFISVEVADDALRREDSDGRRRQLGWVLGHRRRDATFPRLIS